MKFILTLFLAGPFAAQAAPRIGEAQVRADANGQPCFTISEREEKRGGAPEFQAITVSASQRVLWHMAMPRDRTFPVSFSMCIPYGGRVQALPQTVAGALNDGVVYTVRIDARPDKNTAAPLQYGAHFCLVRRPGGSLRIHAAGAAGGEERGFTCRPG